MSQIYDCDSYLSMLKQITCSGEFLWLHGEDGNHCVRVPSASLLLTGTQAQNVPVIAHILS